MRSAGSSTGMGMDIRIAKCSVRGHLQLYFRGITFSFYGVSPPYFTQKSKSFSTSMIIPSILYICPAVILGIVIFPLAFHQRLHSSLNWGTFQFKHFEPNFCLKKANLVEAAGCTCKIHTCPWNENEKGKHTWSEWENENKFPLAVHLRRFWLIISQNG